MILNSLLPDLVKLDLFLSYIPFVSSVVNLVDIFQKCVVLPIMERKNIEKGHYYTYLDQKSFKRCVILLIPVFGNLMIGIYDFYEFIKKTDRHRALEAVKRDGLLLKNECEKYRNDKEIVLAAIQQNMQAAQYVGKELKDDADIMNVLINQFGIQLNELADDFCQNIRADR